MRIGGIPPDRSCPGLWYYSCDMENSAAIEGHARQVGCDRLHLYTSGAEPYYSRLGWRVSERFPWGGRPFVLMHSEPATVSPAHPWGGRYGL
jgi:hypothetical protein